MRPTLRPNVDGLIHALGCEVDEGGFIRADATGKTSAAGVWVAGNAANPRAQVNTAAGEGSAAAIAINADLVAEDVRDACQAAAHSDEPGRLAWTARRVVGSSWRVPRPRLREA
jgi:pyruvate/2-oxoglutarate dehydrogenase complex dihydrolipoamide dehydrogenase (E3) component